MFKLLKYKLHPVNRSLFIVTKVWHNNKKIVINERTEELMSWKEWIFEHAERHHYASSTEETFLQDCLVSLAA